MVNQQFTITNDVIMTSQIHLLIILTTAFDTAYAGMWKAMLFTPLQLLFSQKPTVYHGCPFIKRIHN